MPDIRTFFTSKGSQKASSQEKVKPSPTVARKAAARKRRVIDSEDEEEEAPKRTPPKKSKAKPIETKKEELVDASSFFAASSKNKISRSVPIRSSKPKAVKPKPKAEILDDDDEELDDIFIAAYKKHEDDYKEDTQMGGDDDDFVVSDDEDIKPAKRASKSKAKKRKAEPSESEEEKEPPKKAAKSKPTPSKKIPTKKPTNFKAPEESEEIKKIHANIPVVRAPTPPPRDGDTKFDFRKAVNRDAPPAQESVDLPIGADNCLAGLSFVFTGVLSSLSREDGQQLVKRYGGRVMTAPSKKTSYVVLGNDAGPKKLELIKQHRLTTINEEGLFQLIRTLPTNGGDSNAAKDYAEKKAKEEKKMLEQVAEMEKAEKAAKASAVEKAKGGPAEPPKEATELWTVKYAPTAMNQICGNKGHVEKLKNWLHNWPKNLKTNFKLRGADGSGTYRAAMIHGPPGVGKTTAAHLVARLEGYDILEYNASDTRSKKQMEDAMRGVLDNTSIRGYFAGNDEKAAEKSKKIVLIMDEVDGMSAGDRGGVGQLASMCKKTSVPIICVCNDRKLQKMKPFDFVTMDLPFHRPNASMIRSRIASIAYREGLKLRPEVIDQLVEGTRSDIRQIINMLSTYKTTATSMSFDECRDMSKAWEKHIVFKPWDIAQKLLGFEMFSPNSGKTLNDKMELYFNDHEFSPLMVQENYLKNEPARSRDYQGREKRLRELQLADDAAQSISNGDLVDSLIHGPQQQWSLMPLHGMFSTVMPAFFMHGSYRGRQMEFTKWLGNNSKQGKLARFVKEIQSHVRLRTSGDRHEIRQQYIPSLFNILVRRLQVEGKDSIQDIIDTMDEYFLTREDWDAILELGVGPHSDTTVNIESQTKTAFTRTYNQMSHPMPFMKTSSVAATKATRNDVPDIEDVIVESDDEGPADEEKADDDDDLTKDKYVKQPKKPRAPAKGKGKAKAAGDDEKPAKATKTKATASKAAVKPRSKAKSKDKTK